MSSGKPHLDDSDDEDNALNDEAAIRPMQHNRIQRLASTIVGDNTLSSRLAAVTELKNTIDEIAYQCPLPPQLNYMPPYDDSKVILKQNLPLVSDLADPHSNQALRDTSNDAITESHTEVPEKSKNLESVDSSADSSRTQLQSILDVCGSSIFRLFNDKSDKCRSLSLECIQSLLLAGIHFGRHMAYFIPAIVARYPPCTYDKDMEVFVQNVELHEFYKRGGAADRQDREGLLSSNTSFQVIEPNEELRLSLCRTFECVLRGVLSISSGILDAYFSDMILSLQSSLKDPFQEVKIQASLLLVQLLRVPRWEKGAKYFATGLARASIPNCRHRNARVVVSAIDLFEASVCVPDKDKVKGAGTAAIADIVGYKQENIIPIAAFYDSQFAVSVNTLAEIASHKNRRVRLRCCKMLSNLLVYLPDRYDHQQRVLPYLVSFMNDVDKTIQTEALECMEKCGLQYEREHPDEIIERRQLGVDGEDSTDYDNELPMPFTSRPSLGARLFVRSNTSRFFLAVLNELSSWREDTRKRSLELLVILTVYIEEHLTKDFQQTINSISKAITLVDSTGDGFLDKIGQVLQLMGKYVDPVVYVPLIVPRISGESSSGSSSAEDGSISDTTRSSYAFILAWLLKGAPIHRVLPHWLSIASVLAGSNCIGPYAGTRPRKESLNALSMLIGRVMGKRNLGFFLSYLNDTGMSAIFRSSLEAMRSGHLKDLIGSNDGKDRISSMAKKCHDGLIMLLSEIE
ncbi:hypothetical protein ACHAXS_002844 [Conticribra weissflogii]